MRRYLKRATGIVLGFAFLLAGAGCDDVKNPWDDYGVGASVTEKIAQKTYTQLAGANGARLAFDLTFAKEIGGEQETRTLNGTIALYKNEDCYDVQLSGCTAATVSEEAKEKEYSTYFIDDMLYLYDSVDQTYFIKADREEKADATDSGAVIESALAVTFGEEAEETVVLSSFLETMSVDYAAWANNSERLDALKSVLDKDGVKTAKTVEVSRKTVSPAGTVFDVESRFTTDAGLASMRADVDGVWLFGTEEDGYDLAVAGTVTLDNVSGNAEAIDLPKDKAAFYEAEVSVAVNSAMGINGGIGTLSLTRKNGVLCYKLTGLALLVGRDRVIYDMEGNSLGGNAARFGLSIAKCEDRSDSRDVSKAVGKTAEVVVDYAAMTVTFTSIYIPPRLWTDFY